jgi:hypothetical protein
MKFHSIRDAISYQSTCPVCHSKMLFNDRYAELKTELGINRSPRTKILWKTDREEILIDVDSDYVEIVNKYFETVPMVTSYTGTVPQRFSTKPVYDGHLYERLGMTCDDCCQYTYLIKFIIDIGLKRIIDIELNSETLSIEDSKGIVHEIKNIYATDETEYTYFPKGDRIYLDGSHTKEKSITLPLIPLDLDNPNKTVERIKTLILFS